MGILSTLLDAILPPSIDERDANLVTEEALFGIYRFTYDEKLKTYTALPYREPKVRALIKANKFHHSTHAAKLLGSVLIEMLMALDEDRTLDTSSAPVLLVPIPASSKRRRERGGNQVEWIIENAPKEMLGVYEYLPTALTREHRESQVRFSRSKRQENIRGAFHVPNQNIVRSKNVILIDDVIESGSTMKDAARALKEAGAKSVISIVLAK